MIENRLACLNANFQKREGKLWTYTYTSKTKAQINYIFINKKWNNCTLNCELTPHSKKQKHILRMKNMRILSTLT